MSNHQGCFRTEVPNVRPSPRQQRDWFVVGVRVRFDVGTSGGSVGRRGVVVEAFGDDRRIEVASARGVTKEWRHRDALVLERRRRKS